MNTSMLRRPSRMLALQICLAKCLVRHTTSLACARVIALLASLTAFVSPAMATEHARSIIVQSTTSTQNSGFYRHITPAFTAETGIAVRVIAVGTGQKLPSSQVIACEFWCSICRVFGSGIDSAFYCIMLPNFCANLADSSSGAIMSRRVACRHRLAARDCLPPTVRYPPISPAPTG